MPGDLERQLGQLSGQLSQLQPTLDRIEQRQHSGEEKVTRVEEKVGEQGRQIGALWSRLNQGTNRWWDLAKILLAGLLGAGLSLAVKWQ